MHKKNFMGTYISEIIEVKINNRWRTLKTYYDSSVYKDVFEDEEELIDEFDAYKAESCSNGEKKYLIAKTNEVIDDYDILLNTHVKLLLDKNITINIIYKNIALHNINDFETRFGFLLPQKLEDNFEIL